MKSIEREESVRSTLKLALEALENNKQKHHYCEDTWYSCPKHEDGCANEAEGDECNCGADRINAQFDKAITSIKAALEAHKALAQSAVTESHKQEPVAWMHNHIKGNVIAHRPADIDRHPDRWTALYPEPKPCPTCEALARTVMLDQTYHDTITSQRTWVGLTDEERRGLREWQKIQEELGPVLAPMMLYLYEAIEAKLKEKNT